MKKFVNLVAKQSAELENELKEITEMSESNMNNQRSRSRTKSRSVSPIQDYVPVIKSDRKSSKLYQNKSGNKSKSPQYRYRKKFELKN